MVIKQAVLFVAFATTMTAPGMGAQSSQPVAPVLPLDGDAAVVTILVRPARAAEFDHVIARLKAALQRSQAPARRAQAAGWQIFRAQEQVQGNFSYVMRIDPVVAGQDYDIPRVLAQELPGEAVELTRAYQEAQIARAAMTLSRVNVAGLGNASSAAGPAVAAAASAPVLSFDAIDAAVLTVLVNPELAADFEAALAQMGKALQASRTPGRKRQAAGWKVYKGMQLFSGSLPYVLSLDPVMSRVEYDPMRLIQETFPAEVEAVYAKYRAAYTGQAIARLTNRVHLGQ